MTAINAKKVLKKIGCPFLELVKGDGYWYFVYDNIPAKTYKTESVYCMRLNDMTVDQWAGIGKDFVEKMDAEAAEPKDDKPFFYSLKKGPC